MKQPSRFLDTVMVQGEYKPFKHGPDNVPGRQIQYEIMVRADDGWQLRTVAQEEPRAVALARNILDKEIDSEVKIVRTRIVLSTGFEHHSTIFHEKSGKSLNDKEIKLAEVLESVDVCSRVTDMLSLHARMACFRLLRIFLERFTITPTELGYHSWELERLARQDSLLPSAIRHVAFLQAKATETEINDRIDFLEKLFIQLKERAKRLEGQASRFDKLEPGKFTTLWDQLREREDVRAPAEAVGTSAMAHFLHSAGGWELKFEAICTHHRPDMEREAASVLDDFMADLLCAKELIEGVIGYQENLGDALCLMADLIVGRPLPENRRTTAMAKSLSKLIETSGFYDSRAVLLDRVFRELKTWRPLDKNKPDQDGHHFARLRQKLTDSKGRLAGGNRMARLLNDRENAIAQRENW